MLAASRLKIALFASLLAVGLLGACGGNDAETQAATPGAYVGEVPRSALFVAIARQGRSVLAFTSDGRRVAKWFQGPLDQGAVELMARDGDVLTAALSASAATGTLTIAGRAYRFTLRPASGNAGLYRAEGALRGTPALTGWIVLPDGRQKGVTLVGNVRTPAPRLQTFRAAA